MEKIIEEQLAILKLKFDDLVKNYNEKNNRIKELLKVPEVSEYEKITLEKKSLGDELSNVKSEYTKILQSTCEHPLWYFISDETDSYEQRQLWKCRCLNCASIYTAHSRDFKDKLIIASGNLGFGEKVNASFVEVYDEYDKLKETNTLTTEEITKIMIERYKEKDTTLIVKTHNLKKRY